MSPLLSQGLKQVPCLPVSSDGACSFKVLALYRRAGNSFKRLLEDDKLNDS